MCCRSFQSAVRGATGPVRSESNAESPARSRIRLKIDKLSAERVGDCLIKAGSIDESAIDHRLRDRFPVQVHFVQHVFRL